MSIQGSSRKTCTRCGGYGRIRCSGCNGTGQHKMNIFGTKSVQPCGFYSSSGQTTCDVCSGTGNVD